jgi:SHS2 domain-containing protein
VSSHEFLDHTSETVLRLHAPDLDQLFAEAALAFARLEQGGISDTGEEQVRTVRLDGADPAGLLADFLNELIWLAETERLVPRSARVRITPPASLTGELRLSRLTRTPSLVKAATRHNLTFDLTPDGAVAEITLDV